MRQPEAQADWDEVDEMEYAGMMGQCNITVATGAATAASSTEHKQETASRLTDWEARYRRTLPSYFAPLIQLASHR